MTPIPRSFPSLVAIAALGLAVGPGTADDKKGPDGKIPAVVRGTLLEVIGNDLVIDAEKPDRKLKLSTPQGAAVTIDGNTSDLKELHPGMAVEVVRNKDGTVVAVIAEKPEEAEGDGRELKGVIRRVTVAERGTRLMVESKSGEIYSHRVPTAAKVTIAGGKAEPDRLTSGMPVTLILNKDGVVQAVAAEPSRKTADTPSSELPGLTPGKTSERYEVAGDRSMPFGGHYGGTFAYDPLLGYDYGQQSDDNGYVRPLYTSGREPWTRNVLPRKKALQRAGQRPGQPDPYFGAFLWSDGRGGPFRADYNAWYWSNPSSRAIPLVVDRYRHDLRFGLGEQERTESRRR